MSVPETSPEILTILAEIDAAYLEIGGSLGTVEAGDLLLRLKRMAEIAVQCGCSRADAVRAWRGEE